VRTLVLAGGVSANRRLRRAHGRGDGRARLSASYPRPEFCTDNGANDRVRGYQRLRAGQAETLGFTAQRRGGRWTPCRPSLTPAGGQLPLGPDSSLIRPSVPGQQVADIAAVAPEQDHAHRHLHEHQLDAGQKYQTAAGASAMATSAESDEILTTRAMNSHTSPTVARSASRARTDSAQRGGHALAALEAEEHRVEVAEEHCQAASANTVTETPSRWHASIGITP